MTDDTPALYRTYSTVQLRTLQRAFEADGATGDDRDFVIGRLQVIADLLNERLFQIGRDRSTWVSPR